MKPSLIVTATAAVYVVSMSHCWLPTADCERFMKRERGPASLLLSGPSCSGDICTTAGPLQPTEEGLLTPSNRLIFARTNVRFICSDIRLFLFSDSVR